MGEKLKVKTCQPDKPVYESNGFPYELSGN
jgi:hypothetical protein